MRRGAIPLGMFCGLLAASPCWAHDATFTKDSPKLLYVQGEASRSMPVDGVRLIFTFSTERGSFTEANQAGQAVLDAIRAQLVSLHGSKVSLVHGWDLVRQGKLGTESSGRRLNHTLAVEVEGVPAGSLHEVVSQTIDQCLQAHKKLELERLEVYLTDAKEQEAKVALFKEASRAALASAQGLAEGSGAKIGGVRYLYANSGLTSPTAPLRGELLLESQQALVSSLTFQKSFKVHTELPDQLELSASVVGVFELL